MHYRYEDCLHNILCCWNANLAGHESAGPSFLVHFLEHEYNSDLSFACLEGNHNRVAWTMKDAAPNQAFHVILGRLVRVMFGIVKLQEAKYPMSDVKRTEYELQDLVLADDQNFSLYSRVTRADFLD
jgi:hypothetical protein